MISTFKHLEKVLLTQVLRLLCHFLSLLSWFEIQLICAALWRRKPNLSNILVATAAKPAHSENFLPLQLHSVQSRDLRTRHRDPYDSASLFPSLFFSVLLVLFDDPRKPKRLGWPFCLFFGWRHCGCCPVKCQFYYASCKVGWNKEPTPGPLAEKGGEPISAWLPAQCCRYFAQERGEKFLVCFTVDSTAMLCGRLA